MITEKGKTASKEDQSVLEAHTIEELHGEIRYPTLKSFEFKVSSYNKSNEYAVSSDVTNNTHQL